MKRRWYILCYLLLLIYLAAVLALTFLGREPEPQPMAWLSLFGSYRRAWIQQHDFIFWGIIANVVMMIPMGVLLPLVNKRVRFFRVMAFTLLFSLLIEGVQYMTKLGYFDVDDIWNNLWGTAVGYGFFCSMRELLYGFRGNRNPAWLKVFMGMLPFCAFVCFFGYFLVRMQQG